ncbi:MAG: N-acetylmuramoyl-L-alanine amidase [Acinetobacter sp.]|nr:N-acetylmuramoyl-L-alanine amidase [Acinetobacter sp.]
MLHHTVSPSSSASGDLSWWLSNSDRVGAHFIIDATGRVYQTIDTEYWLHHLYVNFQGNRIDRKFKLRGWNDVLNQNSIGIELDSAGGLKKQASGKWAASFGPPTIIPMQNVIEYPAGYRGYTGFEQYYPAQLQELDNLLIWLSQQHNIPLTWSDKNFDISLNALEGKEGLYSHTSYRTDKSDVHPDPLLRKLLKKYENTGA